MFSLIDATTRAQPYPNLQFAVLPDKRSIDESKLRSDACCKLILCSPHQSVLVRIKLKFMHKCMVLVPSANMLLTSLAHAALALLLAMARRRANEYTMHVARSKADISV